MQIPSWILEGANGATAFVFAFVFIFQLIFLAVAFSKIRKPISFYRQMKPVIALTVMIGGHLLRFTDFWVRQFYENRGVASAATHDLWTTVYVLGSSAVIVGALCWLRVTMPSFFGFTTWMLITLMAFAIFFYPFLA